ncbi:MAG: D-glycero-beta-D-manno-heptose-7-phosphate kinase [Proteobacteria bacterium]|nr:D-glycero-beta-D-manno-heptose-7-phosphate kinase [Pseudomonadota bacterium]
MSKLSDYLKGLKKAKVLVIGDIILDHYIWGKVNRISPEAPVPVVFVTKESTVPGGSANVALNISSINGGVTLCGVIGKDLYGENLLKLLNEKKVDTSGVLTDNSRHTTVKTRVIAQHQHIVRIDKEEVLEVSDEIIEKMKKFLKSNCHKFNVIVISDYAKGLITKKLVEIIKESFNEVFLIADPKVKNESLYTGFDLITPNRKEAFEIAKIIDDGTEETLIKAGKKIMSELKLANLLITRGEEGMSLFTGKKHIRIPTFAQEVFDVSGAGDTVIALLSAGVSSGLNLIKSCIIANIGASVVVGKMGTATTTVEEIERRWSLMDKSIRKELESYL